MNGRPRHSVVRERLDSVRGDSAAASAQGRRHRPDYWLLILAALLMAIGLVVVYSISPGLAASQGVSQNYYITKQLIDVGLGIVTFAAAAYLPTSWWWRAAVPLAWMAAVGCLIVMVTPVNAVYEAHRWIRLGSFSFQIAEFIKVALLVWVAKFLTEQWRAGRLADAKATLRPLVIILLAVGIIVAKLQSDLGSAGVMIAMMGLMAFTVGIPLKKVLLIGGIVLLLVTVAIGSTSYRRERLTAFLHPQTHCQGNGYQACQALISVGSGGLFGLGLGNSVQAYGYTPEASNDSIFAIIAEQVGFIGSLIIITIYGFFISRLKQIIERTSDQFSRLVVVGVLAWLSTQMIINIGAMIGLLPLKGITLPLISQGGTSLIFLTAALGIVFQISRYTCYSVIEPKSTASEKEHAYYSINGRGIRRPHHAATVTGPRS